MLRFLIAFGLAATVEAGLLTDNLGTAKRVSLALVEVTDKALWDEYGLAAAETGRFEQAAGKSFAATAWRLKDPTGAQAAFRWQQPPGAVPGNKDALSYSKFAVQATVDGKPVVLMTHGNYLIRFEGGFPTLDEFKVFLFQLPKLDQSSLPPVLEYMPRDGLIPASDRFVAGPVSLEKFFPKVSPSAAGFHFGTEAITGRFKVGSSLMDLAVFYYPTNQMARDRQPEFQKIDGAMVKRSGPLLAVLIAPPNADHAERLLALVNYKAQVTLSEPKPGAVVRDAGEMLAAIFQLTGVLIVFTIAGGVLMFLMRRMRRSRSGGDGDEPMTTLHISDR